MRPESSPEALELARPCVRVGKFGGTKRIVYHVAPGHEDGGLVYAVCDEADVPRMVEELAHLLAPLVDLGLRRAEAAARLRPLPRMEPANDDPDQNLDPDD